MEEDSRANAFPLTCRPHLRSVTIRTLSRILSYCNDDSSLSRSQIASEPKKPGNAHGVPESENSLLDKDSAADGNPKPADARDAVFGDEGVSVGEEARRRGRLNNSVEFGDRTVEKDSIGDQNPMIISVVDPVDVKLRPITQQEGNGESIGSNKLDLEIERDRTMDENPKLNDTQNAVFREGSLADGELGQIVHRESRVGFINCDSVGIETLSVEKSPFDIEGGHKQNDEEYKQHEMQQEGHQLRTLCYDNIDAISSRPKSCSEVTIIDSVKDSTAAIADQEMEDGEIPVDSGGLMEPDNSILQQVVCEEKEEKEGRISDSFTEKREDFAHTYKEQLRVDKKDMLISSDLAGSFVSVENYIGRNFKGKEIKGSKDEPKKSGGHKIDKVKGASKNDSRKTLKTKARDDHVRGDDTSNQLNASDYLGLPGEVSDKISYQDQGNISAGKDAKFREKKKRKPPTEEKKAKRKLAKKRKRAEQNKKLGVKRLKLQPILKPKVVSDCKFHLKGRCQQGDKCKFSHDAVPLTKSQACTYFAKSSCLKGDECPFDHQLSKYPCHNYMSKGFCSRGDACLFSHQKPTAEGFSVATNVSNSVSLLLPHKTNAKKQLNINGTSHLPVNHVLKDTSLTSPNHPKQHVADVKLKPLTQAPEGLRFLSFAEALFGDTSKTQQDNLPSNKCNGFETSNQQKQSESKKVVNMNELPYKSPLSSSQPYMSSSCGSKDSSSLAHVDHSSVPASVGKYDSNTTANQSLHTPLGTDASNNLERNRSSSKFATQPSAGSIHSRSTDASRILEEFLFSGIN